MSIVRELVARRDAADAGAGIRCFALLCIVVGIHLSTLGISPTIWQDEVQIADWGRVTIFEPESDWSVDMLADGRNVPMLSFVGPVIQELAYRLYAPSHIGTRLSSLLGAVLAVSFFFLWLRRCGSARWEGLLAAGLWFLDPLFMTSYRGGRVDAWAFAVCFAAFAMLRDARDPRGSGAMSAARLMWAGASMVVAVFIWPSAVLLAPLALSEWYSAIVARPAGAPSITRWLQLSAAAAIGGTMTAVLLLALLYWRNPQSLTMTATMVAAQFGSQSLHERMSTLFQLARVSPMCWLAAALVVFRGCTWQTTLALLSVLAILCGSFVYAHRFQYLLPYVALVIAEALRNKRAWLRTNTAVLALAAMIPVSLAFAAKTLSAYEQRVGRDPAALVSAGQRFIGKRPVRVYLEPFVFYFVGRQLGWHMLRPYGTTDPSAPVFEQSDYAIVSTGGAFEAKLLAAGMHRFATMDLPQQAPGLLARLHLGNQAYGGYTFLERTKPPP